jgi:predicted ArsR family transcriptional regulator
MNRKDFLKSCTCGLCTCFAAGLITPSESPAAEPAKQDDWRIKFMNRRYSNLIEILSKKLDKKEFNEIFHEMGRNCSNLIDLIKEHRNDPDGYFKMLKERWHEDAIFDREKGAITITSSERTECACPMIGACRPPDIVCNCSLGWQEQTFETVLGKKVKVELKESILRGGKRCTFEVQIV